MTAILFVFAGSIIALGFCAYLIFWILKQPEGSEKMKTISNYIYQGARGYLWQQYKVVLLFFVIVFCILYFMYLKGFLVVFVPFAFLTGGLFSGFCGWLGMFVATKSNARTAHAAQQSLNKGLRVAFSGGTVMGLMVVGLGLLEMSAWFIVLRWYFTYRQPLAGNELFTAITSTMLCFGMGASSYALFARLGGGIYTKAADVGADLVGKVEAGIPEDDPRNPAVIADQVGDNVGDVAGMGADLYESYVDSIVATMALAAAAGLGFKGVITPLLMAVCGVIASLIGYFFVQTKEGATQKGLLRALRKGVWTAAGLVVVFSFLIIKFYLPENFGIFWSVVIGLLAGVLIGQFTEFFTSAGYKPTQKLADTAKTGPATLIIEGIALGMLSPFGAVLVVGIAIISSFALSGGFANFSMGLYGVGISAVGMLSTLGITLSTDAYGPIADNAGGVSEMAELPPEVRQRTDQLDSLGNTTAATGKGFAIGSAALTALALIVAYRDHIVHEAARLGVNIDMSSVSLFEPNVIIGIFIGAMMPFVFCSLSLKAVGRTAGAIIEEVRRQFREITGLLEGKAEADYSRCVALTTKAAQKEMILPSLLAIIAPIITGILLGVKGEVGLLIGALSSGFVLAVMMANSGGSWDNAKKYIEEGKLGGKGSAAHKAAVIGDTVGDPFKDTAGPSLNILLKLMSMVSIVFSAVIISYSLFK
ncbi:MAG: sodium-translocating pyrophosphatase [Candidatus Omnitrophica bacterium]|nr:sodium-translocating pyrophosphatase [Candidatus Omnitrophota bacterium]